MRKLFAILIAGLLLTASQHAEGQIVQTSRGREFYCMVMMFYGTPDFGPSTEFICAYLSAPTRATATLEIADLGWKQTVTIQPNVITKVYVPNAVEDTLPEVRTNQAIHITADTEIAAYVIYHKLFSTDSYMALPVSALGTQHVAMCYPSSYSDRATAPEIGIVAAEDGTDVTITPHGNLVSGRPAGTPFTVTLNKGETYLVYGDPNDMTCDLTGTPVTSTKPIAVFSGHERTDVTGLPGVTGESRDCLVEQIPPVSTLGTSFLTAPFNPRTPPKWDVFRIVAAFDSTDVMIGGNVVTRLMAGDFYEVNSEQPLQIQTSNPVLLGQYALSATDSTGEFRQNTKRTPWDPALMIIPPTQQFLSSYIFANADYEGVDSSFVNVVIPDTAIASLTLDGSPVSAPFTAIAGSGFSYAFVSVAKGSHEINASAPFGIYVYGYGPADSYANTGGAAFRILNGLLVTTTDIDFGVVSTSECKDTTIMFTNVGRAPITVWKLWLTDSASTDFSIVAGAPPFTLAPGDTHFVTVRFCPGAEGFRGRTFVRVSSNAVERPTITMHGVGMGGVVADASVLDYLVVRVNTWKDSSFTLINTGVKVRHIDSLVISGADAAAFTLQSPIGGFDMQPGERQSVVVRFLPPAERAFAAGIDSYTKGTRETGTGLKGIGALPHAAVDPDTIDFGRVRLTQVRDSVAYVVYTGLLPTAVASYALTGPDAADFVLLSSPVPSLRTPGAYDSLPVRFAPQSTGFKHARLVTTSDAAESTVVTELFGNALVAHHATVTATDTIHARFGDTIHVPIRLLTPLDSALVNSYHIDLDFRSSLLYPLEVRPDESWSARLFRPAVSVAPGDLSVTSTGGENLLAGAGTLYVVDMLVLLSDTTASPLTLSLARYVTIDNDSQQVVSAVRNGLVIIDSVCGGAGSLVAVAGNVALHDIAPNPATAAVMITYETAGQTPAHLAIVDPLGREVALLADGVPGQGTHTATVSASQLPSGAYTVVMRSGHYLATRPLHILH